MTDMIDPKEFPNDKERLPLYEDFCKRYEIEDYRTVIKLYDVDELNGFLPPEPTDAQKAALKGLIGVQQSSVYLDYARSTNTFELIMQWQESTGDWIDQGLGNRPSNQGNI